MEKYQPELWHDLYGMLGASSAALLGLLYIVTSLHLDEIVKITGFRVRALSNSIFLVLTLVEAVAILTPQPNGPLGLEIAAVNLMGWSFAIRVTYTFFYKITDSGQRGGMNLYRTVVFHVCFLLGVAGGLCLAGGLAWGMYLVTASYALVLAAVAMNAWSIMLGVAKGETSAKPRAKQRPR